MNLDIPLFLKEYWQQKPVVIRNAFEFPFWIEANELAGLACEEEVESRIIMQKGEQWHVESGPFAEDKFSQLPETDWTLLVQAVDHWLPDIQQMLESFSFLPRWRLDDVMVSYAPVGGTVSQHYDFFDVFLIQGEGSRKWQVGAVCGSHSELLPENSVRILKEFEPIHEFVLEPGDMLYIPAKHSHFGVSVKDSLTYSVGFRAPSIRDVVDGVATVALESLLEDERYRDSVDSLTANRGEIPESTIASLQQMMMQAVTDKDSIKQWIGHYVTERKYPDVELETDNQQWQKRLEQGEPLYKNPASRFAYIVDKVNETEAELFVDGDEYRASLDLAELLANNSVAQPLYLQPMLLVTINNMLIKTLLENGALSFSI